MWLPTCTVVITVGAAVHQRALQHAFCMHSRRVDACFNAARHGSLQVAGLDTSSALGAFERMEEKVMSLEAQAEAAQMVSRRCCSAAGPDSGRAAGLVDVQPLCARASLRCRSVDYANCAAPLLRAEHHPAWHLCWAAFFRQPFLLASKGMLPPAPPCVAGGARLCRV